MNKAVCKFAPSKKTGESPNIFNRGYRGALESSSLADLRRVSRPGSTLGGGTHVKPSIHLTQYLSWFILALKRGLESTDMPSSPLSPPLTGVVNPMNEVARITGNLAGLTLFDCIRAFFHRRDDPVELVIAYPARKSERAFRLRIVLYPPSPSGGVQRS